MANPLGSAPKNPVMENIGNAINFAKNAGNPQMIIEQITKSNPQAAQMMSQIRQSGQSPKDIALNILQQRGIDPREIMRMIGGR